MAETCDVVVVGSGPAGSALAVFVAQAGYRVALLERASFPRFHIGESLLPVCLSVLDRLGVEFRGDSFLRKRGARFVCERGHGRSRVFDFSDALPGPPRHAWQVDRAAFDSQLQTIAADAGVRVFANCQVVRVECGTDEVSVDTRMSGATQSFRARYLVDASGQAGFLARHFGTARLNEGFGKTAAFVHASGISDHVWSEVAQGFDIQVMLVPEGWGWVIPLAGKRLSVGLVCRDHGPAAKHLGGYLEGSPLLSRWLAGAKHRSEIRTASNFSYVNERSFGARFVCVGDAACFLDPVFSSGVSLALLGAASAAETLVPALAQSREGEADLMRSHDAFMQRGFRVFSAIIRRFYETNFIEHFIFGSDHEESLRAEVTSVLAGDVWREDNAFAQLLLRARGSARRGLWTHP